MSDIFYTLCNKDLFREIVKYEPGFSYNCLNIIIKYDECINYYTKNMTDIKYYLSDCINNIIYKNNIQDLKILCNEMSMYFTLGSIVSAARHGRLDIIKYLHTALQADRNINCDTFCSVYNNYIRGYAMDYAACYGHLDIVIWLHKNCTAGYCSSSIISMVAENGHLDVVKWFYENYDISFKGRYDTLCNAIDRTATKGHLTIIKWFHENNIAGFTTRTMDYAAAGDQLDVVKWLHENRTEGCSQDAINYAADHKHFNTVKWLHDNRREYIGKYCIHLAIEYVSYESSSGYNEEAVNYLNSLL